MATRSHSKWRYRFDQPSRVRSRGKRSFLVASVSLVTSLLALIGTALTLSRGPRTPVIMNTDTDATLAGFFLQLAILLIVFAPVIRLGALAIRWARMKDWRFASAAAGVAIVIMVGALLK